MPGLLLLLGKNHGEQQLHQRQLGVSQIRGVSFWTVSRETKSKPTASRGR